MSAVAHQRGAYVQRLPALGLSIERYTARVPNDGGWYVMRGDEQLGRFRTLKKARDAYAHTLAASGWTPPPREVDPQEILQMEAQRRNDEAFFEYWYGGVHARRGRQRKR